jgi:hypothetical protein
METKADIIEAILDLELEMFLQVSSEGEPPCQQHPEAFKFHRRMQFSVWSQETLIHYRQDLIQARSRGENLMTIKYARMQGLLPCRNPNPLIDTIVRIQLQWQAEMKCRFPAIMGAARPLEQTGGKEETTSFETYARSELETFSDTTLSSLHADIRALLEKGINASEQIYRLQAQLSGFDSLEAAEAKMLRRTGS